MDVVPAVKWLMSDRSVYTAMYTVCGSYLVIQGQVTEGRDVLGPLHQHQQLLFHGLTHVCDGGDLFGPYVIVQDGSRGGDLRQAKQKSLKALLQGIINND